MNTDELQAGPELDALIAEMMGSPFRKPTHGSCCTCQTCGHYYDECQCGYGDDIAMAWRVVKLMLCRGFDFDLDGYDNNIFSCWFTYEKPGTAGAGIIGGNAQQVNGAELAICRAALKAVMDET